MESQATSADAASGSAGRSIPHVGLIFGLVIAAFFMDIIDASIVQVALPSIKAEFGASLADSQWIYGAYAITLAGFLMLMGRAGDVYGQKKVFIAGLVIFTIASFTGGLAPSLLSLVISRLVQGIGAAMTTVTAFAIFLGLYPEGVERNKKMGYIVAVLSGGFAAGATAGGVLTTFLGWRSVMFVNIPIGVVTLLLCTRYLPGGAGWLKNQHLDLPGALTVTAGTILMVYALTNAASVGFVSSWTYVPLLVSAALLGAFLLVESKSRAPLMPLGFLRRGSVLTANALALVLTSIVGGISFIMTIYFQTILGYSPLDAGLLVLPPALIFFVVGGWGAARVINKFGVRRAMVLSSALVAIGTLMLTPISATGSYFAVLPGFLIWAFGASIGMPAVNIAAVAGTKHGEEGLASGVVNTSFRVGFPVGLAVLLTIANVFDPPPAVVAGFQAALFAGALLGGLAFVIALKLKDSTRPDWGEGTPAL